MRKPVLKWDDIGDGDFELTVHDALYEEPVYFSVSKCDGGWKADFEDIEYRTLIEAQLACEDHLMNLIEDLAMTYHILKDNT